MVNVRENLIVEKVAEDNYRFKCVPALTTGVAEVGGEGGKISPNGDSRGIISLVDPGGPIGE